LKVVISNTTEVGLQFVPENVFQNVPASFPGKLLAVLHERFRILPDEKIVVIPTELISDNGEKLHSIIQELARWNGLDNNFMQWLDAKVKFCNSLVDRIVTKDPGEQLLNDIQCFMTMYNALKAKLLEAYDPCSTFPCCYSIDYSIIGKQLSIVNRDIAVLQLAMAQKRKKLSDDSTQVVDCNKKQATLDKANSDIKAITAKPAASRTSDEKDKLDALNKSLHDLQNAVCPKDQITSLTTEIDQLKLDLQTADVITALQTKLPPEQELRGLVVFINNMVAQNQAVISEPIQMRANRLDITINIRSKDSVTKTFLIPTYNNPSIGLEIPVLWHPFISFSSGSFIATGSYLQNKTYDWQPQANTNNTVVDSAHYILAETGYTPPVMGFSALANLEWKVNRTLGWGLSGGVGLTIETKPRLAYLGGGSIMIGDLRQFTFTGGIAIMQVDKLNNGLQAVADQRIIYTSKPSIGYTKVVKTGGFVALTYTPFKVGKRKLKKAS